MDNHDFLFQTIIETNQTIVRFNTRTYQLQMIHHDEGNIPLHVDIDAPEFLGKYLASGEVHHEDIEKFDWILNPEHLRAKCLLHENGTLFVYRKKNPNLEKNKSGESDYIWARVIISVPLNYSEENPDILLLRRELSPIEAEAEDVRLATNERIYKMIRCDLKNQTFRVLMSHRNEETVKSTFWGSKQRLQERLIEEELVHPDDLETFRVNNNYDTVIAWFQRGNKEKTFYYRRKTGTLYHWVKLLIMPATDYTTDNPVFLYMIEDVHEALVNFFTNQIQMRRENAYGTDGIGNDEYSKSVLTVLTFLTQRYIDFYMVDLENYRFTNYKFDRSTLEGRSPYSGAYSELLDHYTDQILPVETSERQRFFENPDALKEALMDKMSVEYLFTHVDGRQIKMVCTKISTRDGKPWKVICRTIPVETEHRLKVKTFGSFEVYDEQGNAILFQKKKSKQVLAYLIDKCGYPVSTADIVSDVLEKPIDDLNAKKYVSTLLRMATKTLEEAGYSNIIIKEWNSARIDVDKVDCDYYHLIDGDTSYWIHYHNEYMKEYSWAEVTNADLLHYGFA